MRKRLITDFISFLHNLKLQCFPIRTLLLSSSVAIIYRRSSEPTCQGFSSSIKNNNDQTNRQILGSLKRISIAHHNHSSRSMLAPRSAVHARTHTHTPCEDSILSIPEKKLNTLFCREAHFSDSLSSSSLLEQYPPKRALTGCGMRTKMHSRQKK